MSSDLVRQFVELWESSECAPDVFKFLEQHSESTVRDMLPVLLADQRRRWQTSQPLSVEDYLNGISGLRDDPEVKVQLDAGELQAKQAVDTAQDIGDVTALFSDSRAVDAEVNDSITAEDFFELRTDATRTHTSIDEFSEGANGQLGRYRLIRVLGEGAFGRVFLGFDDELQRQVAIKVPTPERFRKPEDADAYLAEARTLARLNHPNIVPV